MGVVEVLGQVEAICKGIAGVSVSSGVGGGEGAAMARAPICFVAAGAPQFERLTGGAGGAMEMRYTVTITLVLGPNDMTTRRAQLAATPFFERFRAAFWGDPTLGGMCWRSELDGAATNLGNYRGGKATPQIRWRLQVRELVAADSGMAPGLVAGEFAYIAIGSPGAESEITKFCQMAGYVEQADEHERTPYGVTAETSVPGISRGYVELRGLWSPVVGALLAGLRRVPGQSLVLGPAGSGAGQARIAASGFLRDYAVDADGVGGPVSWRAFFRTSGGFSFGSF